MLSNRRMLQVTFLHKANSSIEGFQEDFLTKRLGVENPCTTTDSKQIHKVERLHGLVA